MARMSVLVAPVDQLAGGQLHLQALQPAPVRLEAVFGAGAVAVLQKNGLTELVVAHLPEVLVLSALLFAAQARQLPSRVIVIAQHFAVGVMQFL